MKKPSYPTSVRLPEITIRQLTELEESWGESRSAAIARAVQLAWTIEFCEDEQQEPR